MRTLTPALLVLLISPAVAGAQTLRNPVGTSTVGGPTRNPQDAGGAPASTARPASTPQVTNAAPDRPAPGSLGEAKRSQAAVDSGGIHIGPQTSGQIGGLGNGVGPAGAGGGGIGLNSGPGTSGGAAPTGLGGSKPNGAVSGNGSKAAPMQANGVRKVN